VLIIAIETSGKNGGIALARGDAEFELLAEAPIGAGQYSAELMPALAKLLEAAHVSKSQIDGFAVASGPGSFTGLRVGISTAKALADALQRPVATVSVLEAIAALAVGAQELLASHDAEAREARLEEEHIIALLDAGRGEVYAGIYRVAFHAEDNRAQFQTIHQIREILLPFGQFLAALPELAPEPMTIATPDQTIAEQLRDGDVSVLSVERPGARDIALLGWQKLIRGESATVAEFDANYIRRSDAEIFSLPKLRAK
jgi:tRNA threonylcarbamoyladenosine biosynthesis protein TsaB